VLYCSRLRGTLRELLNLTVNSPDGQRLLKRYRKVQDHLLLFLSDPTVPPTNNSSEQALRWSVLFAQVRSVVNTAHRQGISAFDAISRALTSQQFDWLLG
jgi:transposase